MKFFRLILLGHKSKFMESNTFKLIRNNRSIQWVVGIVGTLLLGALGSGLWEFVLRDIIVWAGNITLTFISSIWGGYVDLLHRDIGKLHQDLFTVPLFAIVVVFIEFAPWVMIVGLLRRTSKLKVRLTENDTNETVISEQWPEKVDSISKDVADIRKKILRILVPLAVLITFSYAISAWQLTYTRSAANWAERSTEILLPYVTQQEYMKLRSDLRAIEDAEHFYKFEKQLQDFAAKASIKLPAFTVIRKHSST
jgi:hypothetical protein